MIAVVEALDRFNIVDWHVVVDGEGYSLCSKIGPADISHGLYISTPHILAILRAPRWSRNTPRNPQRMPRVTATR